MSLTITKISGVVFVQDSTSTNPKAYFGATGKYQFNDANDSVLITIGNVANTVDQYTVAVGSLTVGTSTPSTASSCKVLLNAIFGT